MQQFSSQHQDHIGPMVGGGVGLACGFLCRILYLFCPLQLQQACERCKRAGASQNFKRSGFRAE